MRDLRLALLVLGVTATGCASHKELAPIQTREVTATIYQSAKLVKQQPGSISTSDLVRYDVADSNGQMRYSMLFGPNPGEGAASGEFINEGAGNLRFQVNSSFVYMVGSWPLARTTRVLAGTPSRPQTTSTIALQVVGTGTTATHRAYNLSSSSSVSFTPVEEATGSQKSPVSVPAGSFIVIDTSGSATGPTSIDADDDAKAFRNSVLPAAKAAGL